MAERLLRSVFPDGLPKERETQKRVPLITDYTGLTGRERTQAITRSKREQIANQGYGGQRQHNYSGDNVWVDLPLPESK